MAAEGAWLDLAPRKHRDRHGPMGPDDSSATMQEIDDGSGENNGGAAEEMDQEGSGVGGLSGRVLPAGWATKTKSQRQRYWQRRRK